MPLETSSSPSPHETIPCTLWDLTRYFLWLGTFGFGGPIALIGYIQRDLVEKKRWFSHAEYIHGMALSQLCPGPLATHQATYLGWLHSGVKGASMVTVALVFPSFLMILVLSSAYIHFGSLPWIEPAFYGIGASVIAVISRSGLKFTKMTVDSEPIFILICLVNVGIAIYYGTTLVLSVILCGLGAMLILSPPKFITRLFDTSTRRSFFPEILITGIGGAASSGILLKILGYFSWAGAFLFGSGLAIIPFLQHGVVEEYHWLTQQQFLDAVAIGLVTPGPALITAAFVGFMVAGITGAFLATVGIFLPSTAIMIVLAPYYRKVVKNESVQTFVKGVSAAIAGAILGAGYILGREAVMDVPTVCIFIVSCGLLYGFKKLPEPVVILGAGAVGVLIKLGI